VGFLEISIFDLMKRRGEQISGFIVLMVKRMGM
jgi:hypothetical protein